MDLPMSQLGQSSIVLNNNQIDIIHQHNGKLITLVNRIVLGSYHVLVRDCNTATGMLFSIHTKYHYDTLNKHTLEDRLKTLLNIVNMELICIGLVYKTNETLFIGERDLYMLNDGTIEL